MTNSVCIWKKLKVHSWRENSLPRALRRDLQQASSRTVSAGIPQPFLLGVVSQVQGYYFGLLSQLGYYSPEVGVGALKAKDIGVWESPDVVPGWNPHLPVEQ